MQLDPEALEAVKGEIQRFHRNSCYPEALDVELEVAAKRILQAVQPVPVATMPSDAEIDALIERLNELDGRVGSPVAIEAAAFLAALRDERDRLKSGNRYAQLEQQARARVRELEKKLERARVALDPFAKEFDERREAYIRRYPRHPAVGAANFDKMPDGWEMEKLVFPMGVFRRARAALAEIGQRG